MLQTRKVSVIIPAFNAETTILKTLDSLCHQTYQNIEIIVIDDGSSDHTYEIIQKKSNEDRRVFLLKQDNQGVSSARNNGILYSTGYYLTFVDADDWLPADSIEQLVSQVNDKKMLVCGSHKMIKSFYRSRSFILPKKTISGPDIKKRIFEITEGIPYAPWGKLFLTNIVKANGITFPNRVPYGEDGVFLLKYLRFIDELKIIDDIVYYYSFTNSISLANKYYKNMNKYLRLLSDERVYTCSLLSNNDYSANVETEYFNRCIKHYIIHERDISALRKKIIETKELFPLADLELLDSDLLTDKRVNDFIRKWKLDNLKLYCFERIKLFVKCLF